MQPLIGPSLLQMKIFSRFIRGELRCSRRCTPWILTIPSFPRRFARPTHTWRQTGPSSIRITMKPRWPSCQARICHLPSPVASNKPHLQLSSLPSASSSSAAGSSHEGASEHLDKSRRTDIPYKVYTMPPTPSHKLFLSRLPIYKTACVKAASHCRA